MALQFPNIDPVLIKIGPVAIRWYSLAYIGGIVLGWLLVKWELAKRPIENLNKEKIDDMILWAIAGIVLGGRLGYTLLYQPHYYLQQPLKILYVWEGGMSFHGGIIGFAVAFFLFCYKHRIPYLQLMDLMACVAPIGIGLGRLANFINGELYGRVSNAPWAMMFPGSDGELRHPSQLYEALLEGLVLFIVMFLLLKLTRLRERAGMLSGLFLIGYAAARMYCEQFREPDSQLGLLWAGATMGQILCVPMILLGLVLIFRAKKQA